MDDKPRKPARAVRVPSLDDYEEMRWELEYILDIQADLRHTLNVLNARVTDLTIENEQLRAQLGKHLVETDPLVAQFRDHLAEDELLKRRIREHQQRNHPSHAALSVVRTSV